METLLKNFAFILPSADYAIWGREFKVQLCDIAGGYTATRCEGGWKDDEGNLIIEDNIRFDVAYEDDSNDRTTVRLMIAAVGMAEELGERSLYVEDNGQPVIEAVKTFQERLRDFDGDGNWCGTPAHENGWTA